MYPDVFYRVKIKINIITINNVSPSEQNKIYARGGGGRFCLAFMSVFDCLFVVCFLLFCALVCV